VFNRTSIIKKRLLFDYLKRTGIEIACTIPDLETCYNRQLRNIRGIVQESVGVN